MYRSIRVGAKWYGVEVGDARDWLDTDLEDIQEHGGCGEPVLLTEDKEEAEALLGEDIEDANTRADEDNL